MVLPLLLVSPATSAAAPSPALKRIPRHDHLRADTGHGVTLTSKSQEIPSAEPTDDDRDETRRPAGLAAATRTPSPELRALAVQQTIPLTHRSPQRSVRCRAPPR